MSSLAVKLKLQQFEGPLELLLSLIDEQTLPISEISLSSVTEQFLAYLQTLSERDAEEIADFLCVAARLLLLKARKLLPGQIEADDDGPGLEDQLRLYRVFVKASRKMNEAWMSGRHSIFRFEPPRRSTEFVPPQNVSIASLHKSMVQLLRRLQPPKALSFATIDRAVSMREKIDAIHHILTQVKHFQFHKILGDKPSRTEIIVSFLALLELVKIRAVRLKQEDYFGDIVVHKL